MLILHNRLFWGILYSQVYVKACRRSYGLFQQIINPNCRAELQAVSLEPLVPSQGAIGLNGCNEFKWRLSGHLTSASRLTVGRCGCERHRRHYTHLALDEPTRFAKEPYYNI